MIIIYSEKTREGIQGAYIAPRFFNADKLEKGVTCVYTNKQNIAEAYKAISVEVRGFPRPKAEEPPVPPPTV